MRYSLCSHPKSEMRPCRRSHRTRSGLYERGRQRARYWYTVRTRNSPSPYPFRRLDRSPPRLVKARRSGPAVCHIGRTPFPTASAANRAAAPSVRGQQYGQRNGNLQASVYRNDCSKARAARSSARKRRRPAEACLWPFPRLQVKEPRRTAPSRSLRWQALPATGQHRETADSSHAGRDGFVCRASRRA